MVVARSSVQTGLGCVPSQGVPAARLQKASNTVCLEVSVLRVRNTPEVRARQRQVRAQAFNFKDLTDSLLEVVGLKSSKDETASDETAPVVAREDAVLVFGASGKIGRIVVKNLLQRGRHVIAALRSADKADVLAEAGLQPGAQPESEGHLFLAAGVDVTDRETLGPDLFEGVTQVVSVLGPVFGRLPEGGMGYLDGMTSERVDAEGVEALATAAAGALPEPSAGLDLVLAMGDGDDLQTWNRLDDVIMGGNSSSAFEIAADGSARWAGTLVVEGGGFCGTRTNALDLDMSAFDGIAMRVKGDGSIFKMNIKTEDQADTPEATYQATFDTVENEWTTVRIPWHEFQPVKRARYDPAGKVLDAAGASKISTFGLVLSRFEFNGMPNPAYHPGQFELLVDGGIYGYRAPRPQLVMVTSAGVERNAWIGDDAEARKADIPIVRLNPGGVLNHKYAGELALRSTGRPYTVVRATGLTDETEGGPFMLEAGQGDRIVGKVGRDEVADVITAALGMPCAAGKTFELRRSEAADGVGKMGEADMRRMFLGLTLDRNRWRAGINPFPGYVPPPPPPDEAQKQEILSDSRVQDAIASNRGGRVRDEEEAARAGSVTTTTERPGTGS